MTQKLR